MNVSRLFTAARHQTFKFPGSNFRSSDRHSWTVHHIVYEQPHEQTHFFIANSVPIAPAQRIHPLKTPYGDLSL